MWSSGKAEGIHEKRESDHGYFRERTTWEGVLCRVCLWSLPLWVNACRYHASHVPEYPRPHFLLLSSATCSFIADWSFQTALGERIPLFVALIWWRQWAAVRQWESGKFKSHPFYLTSPSWSSVIPNNLLCEWSGDGEARPPPRAMEEQWTHVFLNWPDRSEWCPALLQLVFWHSDL